MVTVSQSSGLPVKFLTPVRREANLLWYGPSTLFVAREGDRDVAAFRAAMRVHGSVKHGFLADLFFEEGFEDREAVASQLIDEGEKFLLAQGVTKIDAVIPDGIRFTDYFLKKGYWASRKMVLVEWDLENLRALENFEGATLEVTDTPNVEEVADFIVNSYQPYWQWWKDEAYDRLWERIDYPAGEPDNEQVRTAEKNRPAVIEMLRKSEDGARRQFFIARKDGKIIGFCDAKISQDDDCFDFGVLMMRDHPGKGLGRFLVMSALYWLRDQGLKRAQITTTSGMDDYDPTVYLYVQACGGKILGEFLNLVKHKF